MATPRITIDALPEQAVPEDANWLVVQDDDTTKKLSIATLKTLESTALATHLADTSEVHAASSISSTDSGHGVDSTTVQGQLGQLASVSHTNTTAIDDLETALSVKDVVWVGPDAPEDPVVEMWWDSDAPAAYLPTPPVVNFATDAETITGTVDDKATTPASVQAKFDVHASDRRIQPPGGIIASNNLIAGHPDNEIASDLGVCTISGGGAPSAENIIGGDGSGTVNTAGDNDPQLGTGANYSVITGGYDNVAGGLASVISGFHNYTAIGTSHGTIGGGSVQKVTGGNYATIGGGTANTASGDYSTIAGGNGNTATGHYTFAAGQLNTVSAGGAIALGNTNTVSAASASAIGWTNTVSGPYAMATGRGGHARTQGQRVISSQERAVVGDSQASSVVVRRRTTDATANQILGVTGATSSHTLLDNMSAAVTAVAVAREGATGDSAMWEFKFLVHKQPSINSAIIGTATVTKLFNSTNAAAWVMSVAAASSVGGFFLRCTGEVGKTIDWVGRIDTVEVLT